MSTRLAVCLALLPFSTPPALATPTADVLDVASRLEGAMDSADQATADRSYVDVRVTHCTVRISNAPGGLASGALFLYVEQALSLATGAPYRQRFMRLAPVKGAGGVESAVFEPGVEPRTLVGLCEKPESERVIDLTTLGHSNCSVFLSREGDTWTGSTPSGGCPNDFNGAVRVSSEVTLFRDGMLSWDRGWDSAGKQIWGATAGGYRFRKIDASKRLVNLNAVAQRLSGEFSNAEQAAARPQEFSPVEYSMCPVTLEGFSLPEGARVQFAEQRITLAERVLTRFGAYLVLPAEEPGEVKVQSALFRNTSDLAGLCRRPVEQRVVVGDDVIATDCFIRYAREGRSYKGSASCPSTFRGAVRMDLTEELFPDRVEVWERWYDAAGAQVAGSQAGPYVYRLK